MTSLTHEFTTAPGATPMSATTYELLHARGGRRIERFGAYVLERPCQACQGPDRATDVAVDAADAVYAPEAATGYRWSGRNVPDEPWTVVLSDLTFQLGHTETGQVGLFPEQAEVWSWIGHQVAERSGAGRTPSVLNLFGYTGGSSLAAARAGAGVVHLDASKAAVSWARRNAGLSGLAEAPIRWIVDDAAAFVRREIRRGNRYDGVVLDPPTYGHGARGQPWRLEQDLPELIAACVSLADDGRGFVLLTSHTPGYGPERLATLLERARPPGADGAQSRPVEAGDMSIEARDGDLLRLGGFARFG
jgi:23S rRNA (cytosine1962-C5)-methyltransferase